MCKYFKSNSGQELSKVKGETIFGKSRLARAYVVNTIGLETDMINKYVKHQEKEEKKIEDQ